MPGENLLQCYNRGCGQKYNAETNKEDSCRHHPGAPFFHDAYKGWSCCNKKCTDFTEFLNIKGCTVSKHSNEKPPEPEKPERPNIPDEEIIEVKPQRAQTLKRPPFDSPMVTLLPEIAPSLKQQLNNVKEVEKENTIEDNSIPIGTICKNGGCGASYQGPENDNTTCVHHPGVPIFHEGMKYWSCCQRKTSDFNAFLNQEGCERGCHVWKKDEDNKHVQCRWDYHQTGSLMVVAIYAKQYDITKSIIKLNPIRLSVCLVFPEKSNAVFELDTELRGIVDVDASQVTMFGTKVEIKLKKAEAGSWPKLDIPRPAVQKKEVLPQAPKVDNITSQVNDVDLSDL